MQEYFYLSAMLLFGAVITFFIVVKYVRKSNIKIEDTFFWIGLSFVLVVISAFPKIAYFFSDMLNFQSPINFVFLVMIFLLLAKQFFMSIKISKMELKITQLSQAVAIDKNITRGKISKKENKKD